MNRVERALGQVGAALDEEGACWSLIGGLAVSVRTEPRFTRDVDIAVAVRDDPEAEALVRALGVRGFSVEAVVEQKATSRLATARLAGPAEDAQGVVVDLLFASSGIERELVGDADRLLVMGSVRLPVARTGHLIALKLLAEDEARPLDRADLLALIRAADSDELERARAAVGLITQRGFARKRDLEEALDAWLSRAEL